MLHFKRLVPILATPIFLFFTACGGSDSDSAPPPCAGGAPSCSPQSMQKDDYESWQDLINKMNYAQQVCVAAYAPAAQEAAKIIYATGGTVPPQQIFAAGPAADALNATKAQQQQCNDAINMVIANASTMQGGTYWLRPDVQMWLQQNLLYIGDAIAQTMPPELMQDPAFVSAMYSSANYLVQTNIAPYITNPQAKAAMQTYM